MKNLKLAQWTGTFFILGALLVEIPYTLLGINFEYPQILRQETGKILTKFQSGGTGLIFEWLAFAWVGLPLLIGVILLPKVLAHYETNPILVRIATISGIVALVVQIIGLLRWVFVVPVLAGLYSAPTSSPATREAVEVVFKAIHQFGGVLLGEHLGQLLIIGWMALLSLTMFKSALFKPWLGIFGLVASGVYLLAQTDLLASAIPGFVVVPLAGLVGSLLWLAWMIALGIILLRSRYSKNKITSASRVDFMLSK